MATQTYFPVALHRDIRHGGLFRSRLEGLAVVIWRSDDDQVHVWEDRCPHRSIRISAGRNFGEYVEGIYHGWRFGKDGMVVGIPAEGYAPRPDIKVRALPSTVHTEFVWASLSEDALAPDYKPAKSDVLIRPLPIGAPAGTVRDFVAQLPGLSAVVTPSDTETSIVYGHVKPRKNENSLETVQRLNARLNTLRRSIEEGRAS